MKSRSNSLAYKQIHQNLTHPPLKIEAHEISILNSSKVDKQEWMSGPKGRVKHICNPHHCCEQGQAVVESEP